MEKRFTLALILSLLVLLVWMNFFAQKKTDPENQPETASEKTEDPKQDAPSGQPSKDDEPQTPPETFDEKEFVIENEALRIVVSNKGGAIKSAFLKNQYPDAPARDAGSPNLELLGDYGAGVNALGLAHRSFTKANLTQGEWKAEVRPDRSGIKLTRRIPRGNIGYTLVVTRELEFPDARANWLTYKLSFQYLGDASDGTRFTDEVQLYTSGGVWQEVLGESLGPAMTLIHSVVDGEETITKVPFTELKDKPKGKPASLRGALRYLCDGSNYFGAFLVLGDGFSAESVKSIVQPLPRSEALLDRAEVARGGNADRTYSSVVFNLDLEVGGSAQSVAGSLYLGPLQLKDDALIASADGNLANAIHKLEEEQLGWASFIANGILWLLRQLHGIVGNWGWAIVLLTVIVRALLFPINRRSQGAMMHHGEQMAKIKPKLEALKKKHEKDPRKFAEEQMKLMRSEGVSMVPLGGCLPILLQIPIFFGLFSALRWSIDLRQADWLWVQDLSKPDHLIRFSEPVMNPMSICGGCCGIPQPPITGLHLLPILMTVAWFLNSYLMPRPTTADPQMEQQRKMMMFMPVMFGFMMYSYAAGLSLYWLTSSTLGIFETKVIKKYFPVKPKAKKKA